MQHVRGRNTEDIDLILSAPALQDIPELTIAACESISDFPNTLSLKKSSGTSPQHQITRWDNCPPRHSRASFFSSFSPSPAFTANSTPIASPSTKPISSNYSLARSNPTPSFSTFLEKHLLASDLEELSQILAETRQRIRRIGR